MTNAKRATSQPEREDVPAGAPVRSYKVEVVAPYVHSLGVVGETEAQDAAPDATEFEGGLDLDDLGKGRVGLVLARRSEERRVGKERRSRWLPYPSKKKR